MYAIYVFIQYSYNYRQCLTCLLKLYALSTTSRLLEWQSAQLIDFSLLNLSDRTCLLEMVNVDLRHKIATQNRNNAWFVCIHCTMYIKLAILKYEIYIQTSI